jgi:hypothetical protein
MVAMTLTPASIDTRLAQPVPMGVCHAAPHQVVHKAKKQPLV